MGKLSVYSKGAWVEIDSEGVISFHIIYCIKIECSFRGEIKIYKKNHGKVRTYWEVHKNLLNLPHALDIYLKVGYSRKNICIISIAQKMCCVLS